ncbi:ATP-binding protein [Streptococcus ferus]|uniref:ATP-binding protein n=1 Tax=Streptococcus ferus TaxID=1345 RepID=UPI0023537999|nr:ATP-binding protein [Streptococcus ferus]
MGLSLENKIVDVQENLILTKDGSVFAIYEILPQVVNIVSDDEKEKIKSAVEQLMLNLKSYVDFAIATLPYPKELYSKFNDLSKKLSDDTSDMGYSILNGSLAYLEEERELSDDRHFLCVPLKSMVISSDLKEVVKTSIDTVATTFVEILQIDSNVYEGWNKRYEKQRLELEKNLVSVNYRRLQTQETKFVNRFFYIQTTDVDTKNEERLLAASIHNLGDKDISFEGINHLVFYDEDLKLYVSYLPVAYKPENASYLHMMERVQTVGFPVASFTLGKFAKTKGLPFNNIRTKARFARGRLKGAQEEAEQADSVSKKSVGQSKFLVEKIEEKIDDGIPIIHCLQTLIVSDRDKAVFYEKITLLLEAMKDIHVQVSRATPYQLYLFGKNRFGETLDGSDKNFIQPVEVGAFAEDLFFTERKVGQDTGFYLGMIDNQTSSWHSRFEEAVQASNRPVFVNLFEANEDVDGKDTSNPHVQVSGDTGNGKSYLVSQLHFYASLLDCKTLYIDPKCEKRFWYERYLKKLEQTDAYPELQDYIRSLHFVTLDHTKKGNAGVLDPLVFLEVSEAKDLIVSMISEFRSLDGKERFEKALLHEIKVYAAKRAEGEKVGTLSVFKELQKSSDEKVKDMADLLVEEVQDSVLSLIFSEGQNPTVDLSQRNTIIEIKGLDLPASENVILSKQNRKSMAVLYALGNFCIRFGENDYSEKTLEVFDEAWTFNMTSYGRGLIDKIKRVGRSQNNFLIFVSQEISDSDKADDESTAFGTYFCFHNDSLSSAKKVLNRLKVSETEEITEESLDWFNNLTKGQCLFKDTFGRVERITVHGLFPQINELFKTVREKEKEVS